MFELKAPGSRTAPPAKSENVWGEEAPPRVFAFRDVLHVATIVLGMVRLIKPALPNMILSNTGHFNRSLQETNRFDDVWRSCLIGKLTLFPFGCAQWLESQIGNAAMTYVILCTSIILNATSLFLTYQTWWYKQGSVFSFLESPTLDCIAFLHSCFRPGFLTHLPAGSDGSFTAFQGWRLWGLCALGPKGKGEVQWADPQCPGQMVYGLFVDILGFRQGQGGFRKWLEPKVISVHCTVHFFNPFLAANSP